MNAQRSRATLADWSLTVAFLTVLVGCTIWGFVLAPMFAWRWFDYRLVFWHKALITLVFALGSRPITLFFARAVYSAVRQIRPEAEADR